MAVAAPFIATHCWCSASFGWRRATDAAPRAMIARRWSGRRATRRRTAPSARTSNSPSPPIRGEYEVADAAVREHERCTHTGVGPNLRQRQRPEARRVRWSIGATGAPAPRRARRGLRRGSRSRRGRRRPVRSRHRTPPGRLPARAGRPGRWRTTRGRRRSVSGRRRPGRVLRRGRRSPRRTSRCRSTTAAIGSSQVCSAHSASPFTMNGSARTGTSKSVMCNSGRPSRASAAQYQAVRPTIRCPEITPSEASAVHAANTHSSTGASACRPSRSAGIGDGLHDQADYGP